MAAYNLEDIKNLIEERDELKELYDLLSIAFSQEIRINAVLSMENRELKETLKKVLNSQVVKDAPYVGYSEVISNAHELLKKLEE